MVDSQGRLDVAWLDQGDGEGWHGPQAISDPVAKAGAPVALARQTDTVLTAAFVGTDRRLNIAWLDLAEVKPEWHGPRAISGEVALPGAAVTLAKQSDQVLTALLVDQNGVLDVAWLDLSDGLGWHPPRPASGAVAIAPAGGHLALERQRP